MKKPNPDFWKGKTVLITGHTGFKGSWLTLWLLELGANVHGFSLTNDRSKSPDLNLFVDLKLEKTLGEQHYVGDIRNIKALEDIVETVKPSIVFHLAAQALVRESYQDPLTTWSTNIMGTLNLLEALKTSTNKRCSVVVITTDKVYSNQEWNWGYRENDLLGGHDPYSASKASVEILTDSWRSSFCGNAPHQNNNLALATARAGNVIGGGDWAKDRIVPDAIRAWSRNLPVLVRNPHSTRPWQHVLESLSGYILLGEKLYNEPSKHSKAYNFGPTNESNRSVKDLLIGLQEHWPSTATFEEVSDMKSPHEAALLCLATERAHQELGWKPKLNFFKTCELTASWYKKVLNGSDANACCLNDIETYGS